MSDDVQPWELLTFLWCVCVCWCCLFAWLASQAQELAKAIAAGKGSSKAEVAICVPHPYLDACGDLLRAGGVSLGALSMCLWKLCDVVCA